MAYWPHGLANRPGEPYPATFQRKSVQCSEKVEWTVGESNPDFLHAKQESYRWTNSPGKKGLE